MKQTNERLCVLAQKGDAAALDSLIENNKSFIKSISVSGILYEKGTFGTWQRVSNCSNTSTTSNCMASSNYNTKPGKSYKLEYSATFNYSDGRSETITSTTTH